MSNLENAKRIYEMMGQGQLLDAFDTYYADDVVMQELGEPERVGKSLNREYEEKFLSSIEAFHGMGIDAMAEDADKGIVLIENWMDATLAGVGRIKMQQVCSQTWKDGKVIKEVFYHK